MNFARRTECNKCGTPCPGGANRGNTGGRGDGGYNRAGGGRDGGYNRGGPGGGGSDGYNKGGILNKVKYSCLTNGSNYISVHYFKYSFTGTGIYQYTTLNICIVL